MRPRPVLVLASLLALATPHTARAAWPLTGMPLCNVPEDLFPPIGVGSALCTTTGCARAFTVYWQDARFTYGSIFTASVNDAIPADPPPVVPGTLFIQRPGMQTPGGVANVRFVQCLSQVCPQPSVFVWDDSPSPGPPVVRARREGEPDVSWGPDGVLVADGAGGQFEPLVVDDGGPGAIVTWLEITAEHQWVYAQHLDAFGNRMWGPAGVRVGSDTTTQERPYLQADGAGGAYILRLDRRIPGPVETLALFHLAPDGSLSPGWPASGVLLGTAPQRFPDPLLRAGTTGVWVVWDEVVTLADESSALRPFVSFVNAAGDVSQVLTAAGTPVATGLDGTAAADDAAVGSGDDIVIAYEYTQELPGPGASSTDLYAARFDLEGSHPAGWPAGGLPVCTAPGVQHQVQLFTSGRVFLAWTDERSGDGDIYAQELNDNGSRPTEWPVDGLLVCGVAGTQRDPVIAPNAVGGGFVVWRDARDAIANFWDIYGQTVSGDARLDVEQPVSHALALSPPRPNPARGVVRFLVELPASGAGSFEIVDVAGRIVHREAFAAAAGTRELTWDLRTDAGARARPGVYLVRVRAGSFARATRVAVTE